MTAAEFARLIPGARRHPSGEWSGHCPAHEDGKASLTFRDGDACLLVTCHAGCALESVTGALSLTLAQLRNGQSSPGPRPREPTEMSAREPLGPIVATYDYVDERGALLFQETRHDPKDFRLRRPDGTGGWIPHLDGVRVVPYRLDELAEARRVYVAEGPKDCDALAALGLTATTNHSGAGKWRTEHTAALVAAAVPEVVVLRDNDRPGEAHAALVAGSCLAAGLRVRRVNLPGPLRDKHGEDVSDWLAAGHTVAELEALADAAPILEPEAVASEDEEPAGPIAPPAPLRLPRGFLAQYVAVAVRRTDAPPEAHALTAVGVLSALAGPRVRLPLAYRADGVRLALWTMNVVDSTGGRKTTVNEFGTDVVRQVLGEDAILPWKGSPEAFIQALAVRDGHAAVFARDEYSGLLAAMKRGGYVAGLAQDFIRAYDGLPITMGRTAKMNRKTGQRVDDTDRVRDPYLVKLCAATRTAFVETATIEDVLDGLLARFVFASGTAEEQRPRAMTPAIKQAWADLVTLARAFHDRAEELVLLDVPEPVLDLSWDLEKRFKVAALAHPRPDAARPAMKRLAETALKVAALLAIDRGRAGLDPDDFADAAALVECWQGTTLGLIADIGRSRFQARADKVLATIRTHPAGLMLSALYRAHRDLAQREFDEVLGALNTQRLVHHVETPSNKPGRPPVVYFPGPARDEA